MGVFEEVKNAMRYGPYVLWGVVLVLGGLYRFTALDMRPMHGDEANQGVKTGMLLESGEYRYDPHEHHGPTLYYFALPILRMSGATSLASVKEATLRLAPVLFGLGALVLLWPLRRGLGTWGLFWAGLFAATSHGIVFYDRYYVQESLLAFFSLGVIAAGWRYYRSRRLGWAVVLGVCVGLTHATKETCVLVFAAMAAGVAGSLLLARWRDGRKLRLCDGVIPLHAAAAVAAAVFVSVLFFSSFFTYARGPLDSILTYGTYLGRAEGAGSSGLHDKPWYYYLQLLLYTYRTAGPRWSEAPIVVLAAFGGVCCLWWRRGAVSEEMGAPVDRSPLGEGDCRGRLGSLLRKLGRPEKNTPLDPPSRGDNPDFLNLGITPVRKGHGPAMTGEGGLSGVALCGNRADDGVAQDGAGDLDFGRFLTIYAVVLLAGFSAIPYKTPWNVLLPLQAMTLLAGIGAHGLLQGAWRTGRRAGRWAGVVLLLGALGLVTGGAAHQARQAYLGNYRYPADVRNPYVYAHTSPAFMRLAKRLEDLAAIHPDGRNLHVNVLRFDGDYWPLPWYLRGYGRVGYWPRLPENADADVIIADPGLEGALGERLKGKYMIEYHGLRASVLLRVYIRQDLWDGFIASRSGPA